MNLYEEVGILKTKDYHPYIYFLVDSNIVLVYKIESNSYLQIDELHSSGQWETYILEEGDVFDTFLHTESKPLEGRSYFIAQESYLIMLDKINHQIHKYKKILYDKIIPIHIACSESAAGCIRVGLDQPKRVIGFPGLLSIGPLWKINEEAGFNNRNEWLFEHINFESDDYSYQVTFKNSIREINDIPEQSPIYLWYGDNADEQICLRFILHLLKNKPNKIYLLNTNALHKTVDKNQKLMYSSQLTPEDLKDIYEKHTFNQILSIQDRIQLAKEWENLSHSKNVLRIYTKQEIKEVPEDYFDSFILNTLKDLHKQRGQKEFIVTGELISHLFEFNPSLYPIFLEYRIRHLVYNGSLELKGIPKSMRHYSVKLR